MSSQVVQRILSREIPLGDLSPGERKRFLTAIASGDVPIQPGADRTNLIGLLLTGFFRVGDDYVKSRSILSGLGIDEVSPLVTDKTGARIFLDVFGIDAGKALPESLLRQAKGQHLEDVLGL